MEEDHLEIEDLSKDLRFKEKGFIDDPMNLKYYLGVPLKSSDGLNIGSICVIDRKHNKLSEEQIELLKIISRQVVGRINDTVTIKALEKRLQNQSGKYKKVSHDIRGPIAGVIGLASLITEHKATLTDKELLEMVTMINKSSKSVLDLADEILKEPTPKAFHLSEDFDLRTFREKLETLFRPQAFNKKITLNIYSNIAVDSIKIKKEKLLQISSNLISNAIKFTPNGGLINVYLDLTLETDKKILLFDIQDTGTGISEQAIHEILNGKAESTEGTIGEKGYGLGLRCVKELLEELNGEMEIESILGKGTHFKVKIPFV